MKGYMFMDKYSREFLDFIINFKDKNENDMIKLEPLYDAYHEYSGISIGDIGACARYLRQNGYIEWGMGKNGYADSLKVEHKGLHPYAVGWEKAKEFLFESVFIPIVVALATALLTLWLDSIFHFFACK
jgi:hypothetical protein